MKSACPPHRFGAREVLDHHERTGKVLGYEEIVAERPAYRKTKGLEKLLELVQE